LDEKGKLLWEKIIGVEKVKKKFLIIMGMGHRNDF